MNVKMNDDLPDGSCFSRVVKIHSEPRDSKFGTECSVKKCEYVGSFPVNGSDHATRAEFVRGQLEQMKAKIRRKSVLLLISLSGVKVCSLDGKSVLMAHALRRISFATCDPENCQFSFLAREPNGHYSQQYCHSFVAPSSKEAEELSRVVGAAFRMAYAQQLAQPLSTAPSPVQSETQHRRSPFSLLLASPPANRLTCRRDASSPPRPASRACWAKKLAGKTEHHDPMADQAMEMSCHSSSPQSNSMSHTKKCNHPPPPPPPGNLPVVDLWSPLDGGSSTEESNSPTELNSCRQIKDKPPLTKNVEVIKEDAPSSSTFGAGIARAASGGYINDETAWDGPSSMRISSSAAIKKLRSAHFSPRKTNKYPLVCNGQSPSAPPTDEESLLESSSESSSKRSSRSSCGQGTTSSFSDAAPGAAGDSAEEASHISKRTSHTGSTSSSNSSVTPPPPPERHDSLCAAISEEKELRVAPWFQAGIPREIALEILSQEPIGSFMVRESTTKPGCFALSLRVPQEFHQTGIAHYLIMRTNRGYKIKGFTKEFGTLTALITHHSVMPELLPCPLSLSRYNPTFKKHDSEDMVDISEDPDYNLLSDFRKMLADINV